MNMITNVGINMTTNLGLNIWPHLKENQKIEKSGWWKLGRKSGVWRPKTGFQNFLLDENECFEVDLQFGKVEKMR